MDLKERKAFFEKEGYLVVENLLSAAEIETCQADIHRLHQFAAGQESMRRRNRQRSHVGTYSMNHLRKTKHKGAVYPCCGRQKTRVSTPKYFGPLHNIRNSLESFKGSLERTCCSLEAR